MKPKPLQLLKYSAAALMLTSPFITLVDQAAAQLNFNAPPVSAPGNREAGASRSDSCATTLNDNGLTALIPETNVGFTTQASPSFLVYIPANNAERAEFRLLEADTGDELYAGQVQLRNASTGAASIPQASVVSVSMPQATTSVALAPGQSYLWTLMLVCDSTNRAADIVVTGIVQRMPGLETVDTMTPDQQLTTYAEAGIWQDLVATLAALADSDPNAYQTTWSDVLAGQGLGALADRPIEFVEAAPLVDQ